MGVPFLCPQEARKRLGGTIHETRKEEAMPSTGQRAAVSGIYANDCHGKQIALSKGEMFPPCSGCRRAANWRLIRATH